MLDEADLRAIRQIATDAVAPLASKIETLATKIDALGERLSRAESVARDDLAETRQCRAAIEALANKLGANSTPPPARKAARTG